MSYVNHPYRPCVKYSCILNTEIIISDINYYHKYVLVVHDDSLMGSTKSYAVA